MRAGGTYRYQPQFYAGGGGEPVPNHCGCRLIVTGPAADVAKFREQAKGPGPAWDGGAGDDVRELDLNQFVPIPKKILNAKKKDESDAYNSGGYEWVCNNWGTKWGCYDIEVNDNGEVGDNSSLVYTFHTAWGPFNDNVLVIMSEMFPRLKFILKYGEQGAGFYGETRATGGEIVEETSGKLNKDDFCPNTGELRAVNLDQDIIDLLNISG
jgi:hypothetical protein